MSQPIVFISHFEVNRERLEEYVRLTDQVTRQLETEKPRTAAFLSYLDREASRVTVVHLFADSDAMDLHFEGADERSAIAMHYLTPTGWEIYGPASASASTMMREAAQASGATLTVQDGYLAGFLRLSGTEDSSA